MDEPADPSLEDLVAACAERLDVEGAPALHALCEQHPQHADALRLAIAPLLAFGVVGPTGEAGAATPRRLGEFELVRELGRGGMGVVYEARQPTLDRTVALKVLPTAWVLDPRQVTRFQNEARAAATLDDPHIVRVYVVGTEGDTHYYAMQLVDGVSVRRLLHARRGAEPPDIGARSVLASLLPGPGGAGERVSSSSGATWARRAADLIRQAASALAKAHEVGILHRDIKPGNLLVDRTGHLWVMDFGVAHFARENSELTRSGEFVGTLAYSSPEQIGGHVTVDARSDVYSLGATLYEVLTLRPPFAAKDHAALVRQIVVEEPRRLREIDPHIARDLETIVRKAMTKEPTARYQTAAALASDLSAFLEGRAIEARPVTTMQRALRWCLRNPGQASALAAIVLLTLVVGSVTLVAVQTAHERDRAIAAEDAVSRLSSQHKITSRRKEAESLRNNLGAGRRFESLRLLREANAEIASAAATPGERATLQALVRTDVLASLSLWDATTEVIPGTEGAIPVQLDRSFSKCVFLEDDQLVLRDASGVELARLLQGRTIPCVRFSPDGSWIGVHAEDRLRLWHWQSGRVLDPPFSATGSAACFEFTDRELVACLAANRFVTCDLEQGTCRDLLPPAARRFAAGLGQPWHMTLAPDGQRLAACHRLLPKLVVYELGEDRAPREIALPEQPFVSHWQGDSRHILVAGRFRDVLAIDVEAGAVAGSWQGHHAEVVELAASRGAEWFASSGWDGQVCLWDPHGRALLSLVLPRPAWQLVFSDDDAVLGSGITDIPDGLPTRWRLHPPRVLREFDAKDCPHSSVPWVAFHPHVPLLALSTQDRVLLFDSENGDLLGALPSSSARRLRFLEDGSLLIATSDGSDCRLYPIQSGAGELRVGRCRTLSATSRLREADAREGKVFVWDGSCIRVATLDDRELARIEARSTDGVHLRVQPGGEHAALGTFCGDHVAVWNLAEGRKAFEMAVTKKSAMVCFAPDGRRMVVTGCDRHRVFETGSWRQVAEVPRRRVDSLAGFASFSPDGALLALPATRTCMQVCEAASLTRLFELESPDGGDLCEVAFSADGTRLAAGTVHRSVFVWDLRAAREELRALGLDWSAAAIPPAPGPREPLRLVIDR